MAVDFGAAGRRYEAHAIRQYQLLHAKDTRVYHLAIPDRILYHVSGAKDLDAFRDEKRCLSQQDGRHCISRLFGLDGVAVDRAADERDGSV